MRGYRVLRGTGGETGLGEEDRTEEAGQADSGCRQQLCAREKTRRAPETGEASAGKPSELCRGKAGANGAGTCPLTGRRRYRGGGVPAAVSRRGSPRPPQIRAWRSLGGTRGSPLTGRSSPGSRDPRPGAGGPAPLGLRGRGTGPRGLAGARRAGGRAERAHGSGTGPRGAPTYPEVRLEQCARHGRRASLGAERSGQLAGAG